MASTLTLAGGDASDGHSHADDAPAAPVQADAPRAEAASGDFEIVAVRQAGRIDFYINDFASNQPLAKAKLEASLNEKTFPLNETAAGVYGLTLPAATPPGALELTVSIDAGERSDLLALSLPAQNPAAQTQPSALSRFDTAWFKTAWFNTWKGWALPAALLVIALAGLALWRRRGTLPLLILCAASWTLQPDAAYAHEGHDHADEPPAALPSGSRAQRLPDGSVFMPKPSQYQLGIRTGLSEAGRFPRTLELAGHVIADPAASGLVQAGQTGRIEAGPRGMPHIGMKVRRGEMLAWLAPVLGNLERGNQQAAVAALASELAIAEKRLARLRELAGSVPGKDIEAAVLEVEGLRQRKAGMSGALNRREPLIAPVAGEIAEVKVSIGQILEAREAAFTLVDPQRLMIEALAYDARMAGISKASAATLDGTPLAVKFMGTGAMLKEHALPLQFRVTDASKLVVGQPVKVFAELDDRVPGIRLPRTALTRNAAGQSAVWLLRRAEVFTPQAVEIAPLDATHVVVRGVPDGARVVIDGASLLGQVR